ncbi:MAG: site-specific DNA-methyltransferase [Nocardioides sp.]|nr:site-specific DNA-methyltransferase [Nocardioides sp.]
MAADTGPGAWNTFIEGDNLDVLATLDAGSVDLVYADPPYNTGNDFAYRDRFGAHEAWAAMMRPRMQAVHRVLAPRGALFVSIDDNEAAHLRLLLDEVFGEENFLAQVVVNLNAKGRQLGRGFATSHEYVLVYARDARTCALDASSADTVDEADFPLSADDGRRFRHLPLRNTNKKFNPLTTPTLHYPLYGDPDSGRVSVSPFPGSVEVLPVFGDGRPAVWRWSPPLVHERPDDVVCRIVRGRAGNRVDVFQRDWLHRDGGRRKKLHTIWLSEEIGSTDTAVAELKDLVGHVFESPKPTGLLRRIVATMPPDSVVLDPFAGSGTTGHAVALLNAADGGTRRCISVNSAEPTREGSNARLAGLATVADITRARLAAVAERVGGGLVNHRISGDPDVRDPLLPVVGRRNGGKPGEPPVIR